MLLSFQLNIDKKMLFTKADNLLVAVSGGIDSMVLTDLLLKSNYSFSVAHCNFKLRDNESDKDLEFVETYCNSHQLKFFKKEFDAQNYSESKNISIQMAARELRYAFFDELINQYHFNYILTAHHLNDNIETFFINLIRGSGINGLKGIKEKHENKIRPLLHYTKEDIQNYASVHRIEFRNDRSNLEDKYLRNYLRLNVIPQFKELNPSFEETMGKELDLLQNYHSIITKHFEIEKKKCLEKTETGFKINISQLNKSETPEILLFEILKDFGFNSKVISGIYEATKGIPGKLFKSVDYELIKDRDFLILIKITDSSTAETLIPLNTSEIISPVHLKFCKAVAFKSDNNNRIVYIDELKLIYPLKIRYWQTGDKFKPFGMNGFKKLSDLFVDLKLNRFDKKNVLILENGNKEIIWVLNMRLDNRYKVSEKTKSILKLELIGQ